MSLEDIFNDVYDRFGGFGIVCLTSTIMVIGVFFLFLCIAFYGIPLLIFPLTSIYMIYQVRKDMRANNE